MNTIETLKALADETRLRIVSLLEEAGDLCGCEIETVLGINQSNASRHLTRLRQAGVLAAEKRGRWVHYSPAPAPQEDRRLVKQAVSSARSELATLRKDLALLADYRASEFTCATIKEWARGRPS